MKDSEPINFDEAMNRAIHYHRAGDLADAEVLYRRLLGKNCNSPAAWHLLGLLHYQTRRTFDAVEMIACAITLDPTQADFYCNWGLALAAEGQSDRAEAAYRKCLALDPNAHQACYNMGNILRDMGRLEEAAAAYRQAMSICPDHAMSAANLGSVLRRLGKLDQSIALLREAVAARPDHFEAVGNLANALQEKGEISEAAEFLSRAAALRPDHARIHHNLGNILFIQGRIEEAIASYQRAMSLDPNDAALASRRLVALQYHPSYDPPRLLEEYRGWNERFARELTESAVRHDNHRDANRRLRVGYLSSDFRDHVAGWYALPLLKEHNHGQFEVFGYSMTAHPDAMTLRIASHMDVWRDIGAMGDAEAAEAIRADGIDILVDLNMHTESGRPLILARRPAPVQVAWLAYPGMTGMSAIDYRLTDPYMDPPGLDDVYYAEESVRLPDTFLCYGNRADVPAGDLPALGNGFVTFGCLNKASRINDGVLERWAKVLHGARDSRLILHAPPGAREVQIAGLSRRGIDPSRLEFVGHQPWLKYLETYRRIDVGLDTLPYNGYTTSMDSFWMGVPMVTRLGKTVAGRAGWSLACNLRLTELAAKTDEEFVKIAVGLAGDLPRLAELRRTLRDRMRHSPLADAPRFGRNVESAYRRLWRRWCGTSDDN